MAAAPGETAPCEVAGDAVTAEDAARALAACETARHRFAELFGEPVPGVRVILEDRTGYRTGLQGERAAILWPTSRAMGGDERHVASQWRDVLPHEIAHTLLAARYYADGTGDVRGAYGTPLPDWFDEGVAIWAESLENRRGRLAQARALTGRRRELRAILDSPHPAARDARILAIRDGAAVPLDDALRAFYPQAIAVLAFVHEAGGGEALRALGRRLVADPEATYPLAGLPGLPADAEAVEAAWEAWLGGGAGRQGR